MPLTQVQTSMLGTGAVLQVVSATNTTYTSITGTSYADTSLTASITPTSSSSKILVLVYQPYRFTGSANGGGIQIVRGSTAITTSAADTNGPYLVYLSSTEIYAVYSSSYLDSPATTSSTTYKTQARPYAGGGSITFQTNGSNGNTMSTITLLEIAA
jgi:hypothetical protein